MKTISKKTIAKEIIYFFSLVVIVLIFWAIILIRNFYSGKNINTIANEISVIQLQIDKNKNINDFFLEPDKKKILFDGLSEMHNNGSSDDEIHRYIDDFESLFSLEKINLIKKTKIFQKKKSILLDKLNYSKKYFLNENEKKSNILIFSAILFGLLYPIRLIYRLLKWSFLTIQTKV
ncbi:hypothetical protein [Flavobacterium sp. ZS1P14]|uniref:hypothetical protein n=1 Tax=Flavobacterium sp. ZS1P14 TaxID=3401729 RepID=UPI003AABCBB9